MKLILSNSPAVLRGVIQKSTCVKWLVTKVTWFANGTILVAYCYQKHRPVNEPFGSFVRE